MPALLIAIILTLIVIGQLMAKQGALILAENWDRFWAAAPYLIVAYSALMTRGVLWILVLRKLSLTLAYPTIALSYVAIMGASYFLFNEPVGVMKILGAALVVAGVTMIGLSKLRSGR